MRSLLPLAVFSLSALSAADRLITIPTGSKIKLDTIRAEGLWEQSRSRNSRYYIGAGLTNAIDFEFTGERFDGHRFRNSVDLSYNYIPPIIGFGPGISFGVQDAFGVTRGGRRFFLAITTREGFADSVSGAVPAEITIGAYFGSVNAPFVGVMLPFTDYVRALAEFDGRRINAGVEFRPMANLGLRATFERNDVLIGAQVTLKF
ncbi:MAG TPA: hypothetical protein VJ835_03495 [Fimbriimonadaceae bacterium]|nr:hypothetical protein [Fimbriimonadaceae bacterium]